MGKIQETIINKFSEGMVNDPRVSAAEAIEHFDALTDRTRLIPYRSAESGDSDVATNRIANYCYNGTTLYGMGASGGTGPASVLTRTAFADATWGTTNGSSNIGGSDRNDADIPFFTYYKKTARIYGARGARYFWSIPEAGGSADTTEGDTTSYSTVSNGIVHSKDDILYVGHDNKISSKNG